MKTRKNSFGFALPVIIVIIAIVALGAGAYFVSQKQKTQPDSMEKKDDSAMMKDGEHMMEDGSKMPDNDAMMGKDDAMMQKDEGIMMGKYAGKVLAGKESPLLDFTKSDYDAAIKSDKLIVLYFYANWCPLCKEEVANALIPAFNELTTDKVVGIRINYKDSDTDTEEENLARQYGISYQHTKVFVKNGKQILKAPDSWDEKRYDMEIGKVLAQ